MKTLIRNILLYTLALYFLPSFIPGLKIEGGMATLFIGGAALAFMFMVIRPILHIISFPINIFTLGLFAALTNVLILYLFTIFVTSVSLTPFTYDRFEIYGFVIPSIHFNTFFAYAYTAFILWVMESFFVWLTTK